MGVGWWSTDDHEEKMKGYAVGSPGEREKGSPSPPLVLVLLQEMHLARSRPARARGSGVQSAGRRLVVVSGDTGSRDRRLLLTPTCGVRVVNLRLCV